MGSPFSSMQTKINLHIRGSLHSLSHSPIRSCSLPVFSDKSQCRNRENFCLLLNCLGKNAELFNYHPESFSFQLQTHCLPSLLSSPPNSFASVYATDLTFTLTINILFLSIIKASKKQLQCVYLLKGLPNTGWA